jgi:hypothetical protein
MLRPLKINTSVSLGELAVRLARGQSRKGSIAARRAIVFIVPPIEGKN